MTIRIELDVDSLVLELGPDGRLDEAAVRRRLADAFAHALPEHGPLAALAATAVSRQVVRDVRGVVPPC